VIDVHEHFVKQSLRTRCNILTANGPAPLAVGVAKMPNWPKTPVREVRVDYSKTWQHRHWMSLVSAYRSAPYFDHYAPRLEPFYTRRYDFLLDLDLELTTLLLEMIGSDVRPVLSQSYVEPGPGIGDLRHCLSEKPRLARPDPHFTEKPYYQAFAPAGFVPGLSVVDLLFAEGPHTLEHLRSCVTL
jgi:hypothetical protein